MQFRTEIKAQFSGNEINHTSPIVTIGSCFSDHIGNWLKELKFNCSVNMFGIVYNPISIASYFSNSSDFLKGILYANDSWVSLNHHSKNNQQSKEELINHLNHLNNKFKLRINEARYVFITLGTAWVYRYKENNEIVANCHKIPQNSFQKELLTFNDIVNSLQHICDAVSVDCKVIFTISPVRHLKDGIAENFRSKARLIESVHQVIENNPDKGMYYPAFEIFMDDLRDYRYYETDLIHPNNAGLEYVKEHFSTCFFSNETVALNSKIRNIISASRHKLFNLQSTGSTAFLTNTFNQIKELQKLHPHLNFSEEIKKLN